MSAHIVLLDPAKEQLFCHHPQYYYLWHGVKNFLTKISNSVAFAQCQISHTMVVGTGNSAT